MSMKAFNLGIIGLFLMLLGVSSVAAITVNEIDLTDCKLDAASYACNAAVTASCLVTDFYSGTVITNVYLTVGSSTRAATLTSGTTTNGTWSVSIPNTGDAAFGTQITLGQVQARASDGHQCTATQSQDVQGCYVRYGTTAIANNSCSCQYTRTTGTTTIANTQSVTITPSSGCADTTPTTYLAFADFCDPQWVASYSSCSNGSMTKTYNPGNPSCCAQTGSSGAGYTWFNHNTGSDCLPPIDSNTEFACSLETHTQSGSDVGNNLLETAATSGFNLNSYTVYSSPIDADPYPLLAYDFDGDGTSEIVSVLNGASSYINLLSGATLTQLSTAGGSVQIASVTGSPAISGVTKYSNGTIVIDNVPHWIMTPSMTLAGSPRSAVYAFSVNGSTLNQQQKIDLSTNTGAGGVSCVGETCYFLDLGDGTSYSYDVGSNSLFGYGSVNVQESGGTLVADAFATALNNKPVYIPAAAGQTSYVAYLGKTNFGICAPSCITAKAGRLVITVNGDVFGYHDLDVQPIFDAPPTAQTSYILRDPVVIGRKVYIPFEETYSFSGGSSLKYMGVYVVSVLATSSNYVSSPQQSSVRKLYWKNIPTSSDEGISNAVSDGVSGYVKLSAQTVSQSLSGTSSFAAPVQVKSKFISSLPYSTPGIGMYMRPAASFLSADGNYVWSQYATSSTTGYLGVSNLNTGSWTSLLSLSGIVSPAAIQADYGNSRIVYPYSEQSTFPNEYLNCYDITSPGALSACVNSPFSVFISSSGYKPLGQYSGGMYGNYNVQLLNAYGASTVRWMMFWDSTKLNSQVHPGITIDTTLHSSFTRTLQNGQTPRAVVAVNRDSDITLFNHVVMFGLGRAVAAGLAQTPTNNYCLNGAVMDCSRILDANEMNETNANVSWQYLPSDISGAAFNFDWITPRYINTAGQKVKILSMDPISTSTTAAYCGGSSGAFKALYYNSDRYILGIHNIETKTMVQGTSFTFKGPQFAYCDFSDDSNPVLVDLGIYLDGYTTGFAISGTYAFNSSLSINWVSYLPNEFNLEQNEWHTGSTNSTWRVVVSSPLIDSSIAAGYRHKIISCHDNGPNTLCTQNVSPQVSNMCAGQLITDAANGAPFQNGSCLAVYSFGTNREAVSNGTVESTQVIKFDTNGGSIGSVTGAFVKSTNIALADADADGYVDVVSPFGVYSFAKYLFTSAVFGSYQTNENIVPIDLNGDKSLDFLISGNLSASTMVISTPNANALLTGALSVANFRCSQVPGASTVLFQLAATAPTPSSITVAIDPNDGRGFVTQIPTSSDGSYVMSYAAAGSYAPTVRVTSLDDQSISATATCSVNVSISNQQLTGADCSLGSDGEFSYTDSVTNHNWKVTGVSTPMPSNGKLYTSNGWTLTYPLNECTYNTVTVEAKLIPGFNSMLQIIGSSETYGIRLIADRTSYAQSKVVTEDGLVLKTFTWDGRTNHIYAISVDRVSNKVYYYEDGVQLFVKEGTMISPQSVKIADDGLWDYVRTSVSGTKSFVSDVGTNEDITGTTQFLTLCDNDALAEASGITARTSSVNVDKYCASANNGVCSGKELAAVVAVAPNCYKESYNYCVRDLYPATNKGASSSTAGVFCNALLLSSVGVGQVAVPVTKGFWSIIVMPNLQWILVGLTIVLVILVATAIVRKRSR